MNTMFLAKIFKNKEKFSSKLWTGLLARKNPAPFPFPIAESSPASLH